MSPVAKVSEPRIARVVARARLFRRLDAARRHPVVWIQGLPGAGKTTLVASWLRSRGIRSLWYHLDAGDAELATFFYYLGIAARKAAPRRRSPLPLLTPEYLQDVPTFARAHFRELCSRLAPPFALVFDDFHEVAARSELHVALREALLEVPERITAILVSRGDPPPELARLRANGAMAIVRGDELQLTLGEAKALASLRAPRRLSGRDVQALHARSGGWTAGLVLMLADDAARGADRAPAGAGPREVFDYFAGEILDRAADPMRRLVLETAILPKVTPAAAERLTGIREAPQLLADLARQGYFTTRVDGDEPGYEYHPLFREFLLARGREALPPGRASALRLEAARLCAHDGQTEAAVELLRQAGAWDDLAQLALESAERMIATGRARTLARWIEGLPPDAADRRPALSYWLGVALLPSDPRRARRELERSLPRFLEQGDPAGAYLAWAAGVETFIWEWADFTGLDDWLATLDRLRGRWPEPPGPEIAARVALTTYSALMLHRPDHPGAAEWEARAIEIALGPGPPALRLAAGTYVVVCTGWFRGELRRVRPVVEALAPLSRGAGMHPHTVIMWRSGEAPYHWNLGATEAARRVTRDALALAEHTGIRGWDPVLQLQRFFTALAGDDRVEAEGALAAMKALLDPVRRINVGSFEMAAAMLALRRGEHDDAAQSARRGVELFAQSGYPFGRMHCELTLARALLLRGALDDAAALVGAVRRGAAAAKSSYFEYGACLIEALLELQRDDAQAAVASLRAALALGRSGGFVGCPWLSPADLAELCAAALEHGVEDDHARALVERLGLRRPAGAGWLASWPAPVRIDALGALEVSRGGIRVVFGPKTPRKPLELLRLLVAHGARGAALGALAEALWPDADGDVAHHALETTLYRLRRLLGDPAALVRRDGRAALDGERVFVDAWAVEALASRAEALRSGGHLGEALRVAAQANELYRGDLLPDDDHPDVAAARKRLRDRVLRHADVGGA
jgi:ATP/maltotriose-dependent transcriptional regulator MalT